MILRGRIRIWLLHCIILPNLVFIMDAVILQKPFEVNSRDEHMEPGSYLEAPVPGENNIILLETSCAVMNFSRKSFYTKARAPGGGLRLTARAACALESAARAHPLRPVYYVHTCPVNARALRRSAPLYARRVLALPNVHLWVVPFADVARGTVLEQLLRDGTLAKSKWITEHASDTLRLLLLRRYGGTYLDTDMLILKSLGDLKNFAVLARDTLLYNAIMDFAWDPTGREIGEECLNELKDFRTNEYNYNGPDLITRVMQRRCDTNELVKATPEMCGGFHFLPSTTFFPIFWRVWEKYFEETGASSVMKSLNKSSGVHIWNTVSFKKKIRISLPAMHPYAQLARRVCPNVVVSVGNRKI